MELSEATAIVRKSLEICPNKFFYIKTDKGQYGRRRLLLGDDGRLLEYVGRSVDKTKVPDTTHWIRLRPRFTDKIQLFRHNIFLLQTHLYKSGLWEELLCELDILSQVSDKDLTDLYEKSRQEQRAYLAELGLQFIDCPKLRSLLYDVKCVRTVYYGNQKNIESEFKEALGKKQKFNRAWRMTYDNTITYDPDQKKAWYSEEYRGQKYGHYYILLDHTHVVFQKDK